MKNKYQKTFLMVNDSFLVIIIVIINAVKHVVITLFPNHIICIICSKWKSNKIIWEINIDNGFVIISRSEFPNEYFAGLLLFYF